MAKGKDVNNKVVEKDVNVIFASNNAEVRKFRDFYISAKNSPNKILAQQHLETLTKAVRNYMNNLKGFLLDGTIKADHTGLLNGESSFGDEVNEIAKAYLEEAQKALPNDGSQPISDLDKARIMSNDGNFITKLTITAYNGVKYVFDKVTGLVMAVYGYARRAVGYILSKIRDWYLAAKAWLANLFGFNKTKELNAAPQSAPVAQSSSLPVIDVESNVVLEPTVTQNLDFVPAAAS